MGLVNAVIITIDTIVAAAVPAVAVVVVVVERREPEAKPCRDVKGY